MVAQAAVTEVLADPRAALSCLVRVRAPVRRDGPRVRGWGDLSWWKWREQLLVVFSLTRTAIALPAGEAEWKRKSEYKCGLTRRN